MRAIPERLTFTLPYLKHNCCIPYFTVPHHFLALSLKQVVLYIYCKGKVKVNVDLYSALSWSHL